MRLVSYRPATPASDAPASKQRLTANGLPQPVRLRARPQLSMTQHATGLAFPAAEITPKRLTITLPVPPSINHHYATVQGRRVMSTAGRAYKTEVGQRILTALAGHRHRADLLACVQAAPLTLTIRFYFASAIRRDVDGGLKITQDAVCDALGVNDNRIAEIHLYKRQDREAPRIELSLAPTQDHAEPQ